MQIPEDTGVRKIQSFLSQCVVVLKVGINAACVDRLREQRSTAELGYGNVSGGFRGCPSDSRPDVGTKQRHDVSILRSRATSHGKHMAKELLRRCTTNRKSFLS